MTRAPNTQVVPRNSLRMKKEGWAGSVPAGLHLAGALGSLLP